MAFARIADRPIRVRSQIYEPDYVIVQDVTLLDVVDVASGLKPDGKIIINTDRSPELLKLNTKAEVITIDATHIAMEILGRPIVNTTMLGAFCGASKEIGLESLNKAYQKGYMAGLTSHSLNQQPYTADVLQAAWEAGWSDGQEQALLQPQSRSA